MINIIRLIVYQLWFAFAFVLAKKVSRAVGQLFYQSFWALVAVLPFMGPITDAVPRKASEVDVHLCYPYDQLWFRGGLKQPTRFPRGCPTLFMYGRDKNMMFHTPATLTALEEAPGCRWKEVAGGHWFVFPSKNVVLQEINLFLQETATAN